MQSKGEKKIDNSYDTHRAFEVSEFIFDKEIEKIVNNIIIKYRDEFRPNSTKELIISDKILAPIPLLEELKFYYNNDLCLAVATSIAVSTCIKFNLRTHGYYLENAVYRIANAWEYLYIILNEFLNMKMIVGKDLKAQIIDINSCDIYFIKTKNGYQPRVKRLHHKIIAEIEKAYKLFEISINPKKSKFHKFLKKEYAVSNAIQKINELFGCNDVKDIIELRNEATHRRPISAKYSVAPLDFFPAQAISINPKGWHGFQYLGDKLEKNLSAFREALHILVDIVFNNDLPNKKINEGKEFFVYNVYCNICLKNIALPDYTVEFFQKYGEKLVCPYCNKLETEIKDKIVVNDQYYWNNLNQYNEFLFRYWKRNSD